MSVIETSVGEAAVLHRLALAVEVMDPLTDQRVITPARAGWELLRRTRSTNPTWPCAPLDPAGPARFKLRHQHPLPRRVVVRLDDPARKFVARRLRIKLWPVGRLDQTATRPYIPTSHRMLRAWLWPGAATALPVGSTVVRGRVVRTEGAARWVRVTARDRGGAVVGRAHGDDRGEFVLVVDRQLANPVPDSLALSLRIHARAVPDLLDAADPYADLVVERVRRSFRPPSGPFLDTPTLRGVSVPTGYVANSLPDTPVTVPTGTEVLMVGDIDFTP
jgi:hypothetical protein